VEEGCLQGVVAVGRNKRPFSSFRKVSSSLGVASIPFFRGLVQELSESGRLFVSRIHALADRAPHRSVVNVLEIRIASFVGRPALLAVSGFVGQLADPVPGASGSSE